MVEEYFFYFEEKGFYLVEDVCGFILFGQQYMCVVDEMVIFIIEWILKV